MAISKSAAARLRSATTVVDVGSATAPSSGQVLTATSSTAATWQDAAGGGSASFVSAEVPSGTINGSNTSFTIVSAPVSGTLQLYRDGQLMTGGGADYTLSGTTITMVTAPATSSVLLAYYQSITSTAGNADLLDGFDSAYFFGGPQGYLLNGKISVTVASNNLTVAIKTLAGSDPSASDPVKVRIGDTVRNITAALSVTKNAGTNWCNSGGTELAAKEADYFVYLGYNATDGVVIGFSRIPYATQYDDFSATTTNEKYAAISTITTAASTDYYELIGRFAATLSAGAGYTWTVPTFTSKNLIQRPIYETRWLTWQPAFTGFSVNPTGVQRYMIRQRSCFFSVDNMTNGTSNANTFTLTLPIAAALTSTLGILIFVNNNSTLPTTPGHANYAGTNVLNLYVSWSGTVWATSNNKNAYIPLSTYEI